MRRLVIMLVVLVMCPTTHAEYAELKSLKRFGLEALSRDARWLTSQDAKFEGIVAFGKALAEIEDASAVDLPKLTFKSKDYWRAVVELMPENSAILLAHAHLHVARGEPDYADAYFLLATVSRDEKVPAELNRYRPLRDALNQRAQKDLDRGIKLHDIRRYTSAIRVCDQVLAEYPGCALAYYEKGFAYLMMSQSRPAMKEKANAMYAECRSRDPLYWKAYQGGGPTVVAKLTACIEKVTPFVSGKQRNKEGLAAFAEGCEAMELYPFAAHAQFKLAALDSDRTEAHLRKLFDLIEKCGCAEADFLRRQLKLDDAPEEASR